MTLTIERITEGTQVIPNVVAMHVNSEVVQYRVGTDFTRVPINEVKNIEVDMTLQEMAKQLLDN